jgi:NAD(P)H-nitrite reductase large subunit
VISKEGYQPIDRTKLSKALLADLSKAAWRQKDFYKDASIDFVEGEVKAVDFSSKKVSTKSGQDFEYSKLVLATGGTPRWLPLDGLKGDLGNVFLLRTLPDTQNILKAVGDNGKKVVVIGSSFIGMEVGNCLAGMKNDVTIIGMEEGAYAEPCGVYLLTIDRANGACNGQESRQDLPRPPREERRQIQDGRKRGEGHTF